MNPVSIPGIVIYLSLLGVEYTDHETEETVAPVYILEYHSQKNILLVIKNHRSFVLRVNDFVK